MKATFFLCAFGLSNLFVFAGVKDKGRDDVKDKAIFLTYESSKLYAAEKDKLEEREPLKSKHTFSIRGNHANVYMRWLNPLKYQVIWKDSIYDDPRDVAVKEFIGLLAGQFGNALTDLNSTTASAELKAHRGFMTTGAQRDSADTAPILDPITLKSAELIELYLHLIAHATDAESITKINPILKELELLDALYFSNKNLVTAFKESFNTLYLIDDYTTVNSIVSTEKNKIKDDWEAVLNSTKESQDKLAGLVGALELKSPLLNIYVKSALSEFSAKVDASVAANKKIIEKLKLVLGKMKDSVKTSDGAPDGFFLVKEVSFEDGKVLETALTINELEFKEESLEYAVKGELHKSTIVFRAFDCVDPVVSSGIFYSDTEIKGYGVSTNANGDLEVAEDNIESNAPVVALFLNLNFNLKSRYVGWLGQIGIDPTKKRPYLLLGTGFSIPVARIAITGGGIWTWNQELDKLTKGQVIDNTTKLEDDIKYKFDVVPKGWYVGIQYVF